MDSFYIRKNAICEIFLIKVYHLIRISYETKRAGRCAAGLNKLYYPLHTIVDECNKLPELLRINISAEPFSRKKATGVSTETNGVSIQSVHSE